MRPVIKIVLAVSCLVVLSACGSGGVPTATATRAATVPATATATPSAASSTATATPSAASSTSAQASPVVEKRIITDRRAIPFKTMRVNDSTLSKGTTGVRNTGSRGVEIFTYEVTFRNGIQTHKELIRKVIVRAPETRVIAVGTKETQQCDPNYSGACVPIASDVDCAGGSGNGPAYVQGPVQVVGTDIYGLDRDGDGIGCEES
jgi:resuscitation-promoting factor RpfB